MMFKAPKKIIPYIFLILFCNSSYSAENTSTLESTLTNINPLDIWRFTPGIGTRIVTLNVTRKSDGYTGELTNDDNVRDGHIGDLLYLSLDIESPSWMFSKDFGVSIRSQTQSINIFRQRVTSSRFENDEDIADLGTSAQGYYTYIGPTLFAKLNNFNSLGLIERLGLGFVYWKANITGDIILAPNNDATSSMPKTNINDTINNTIGPFIYYQWLGKRFLFELSLTSVTFSNDQYKSKLEELNLSMGVTF